MWRPLRGSRCLKPAPPPRVGLHLHLHLMSLYMTTDGAHCSLQKACKLTGGRVSGSHDCGMQHILRKAQHSAIAIRMSGYAKLLRCAGKQQAGKAQAKSAHPAKTRAVQPPVQPAKERVDADAVVRGADELAAAFGNVPRAAAAVADAHAASSSAAAQKPEAPALASAPEVGLPQNFGGTYLGWKPVVLCFLPITLQPSWGCILIVYP